MRLRLAWLAAVQAVVWLQSASGVRRRCHEIAGVVIGMQQAVETIALRREKVNDEQRQTVD